MTQDIVNEQIEKLIKEYEEEIEAVKNEIVELKVSSSDKLLSNNYLEKHEKLYFNMIEIYRKKNMISYRYYAPPHYFKAKS
jgi:hypothetical protein